MKQADLNIALLVSLISLIFFYLFPFDYSLTFVREIFKYVNFLLFFIFALFGVVHYSKHQVIIFLSLVSLSLQGLQALFTDRDFNISSVINNFIGIIFGANFMLLLIILLYFLLFAINSIKTYGSNYESELKSLASLPDIKKTNPLSFLLIFIRKLHFRLNKLIPVSNNLKMHVRTDLSHRIEFPVMSPSTFKVLKKNTQNINNIFIFNTGFFSQNITLTFNDYGENYSALNSLHQPRIPERIESETQYLVKFQTADSFFEHHDLIPDFIKMDCESSELEILKGMSELFHSSKPYLLIEFGDIIGKNFPKSKPVHEYLVANGYNGYIRLKEGYLFKNISENYSYANVLFVPPNHLDNFLFSNTIITDE